MARRAQRNKRFHRPATPRYLRTENGLERVDERFRPDSPPVPRLIKEAQKRRVTFADHDEVIVDKKPREKSPEIFEPFEPLSPPRALATTFSVSLDTLSEDEEC
ncbi:unnamed protein product, partial [Mesorhabditis spiculigera]